jgi:hypothetical protein
VPTDLLDYFKNITNNDSLQGAGCCGPSECWDSSVGSCISEQLSAEDYYQLDPNTVYKCLMGFWVNVLATGKRTPDGCFAGICPSDSQCLFNIYGDPFDNDNVSVGANPQCVGDGQFVGDFLCDNGNWTTRTKMLAQKLASLVGTGNFVLMCGDSDDILVNEQNPGNANNYCLLNLVGQRIVGTTLNQPLYDGFTHDDFITALEQSFLLSYAGQGVDFDGYCTENTKDFQQCVDNQYLKLYYDDDYGMVLFSEDDINLGVGLGQSICNALPSWLKWLCPRPSQTERNLENLRLFNRVYAAKLGNKQVFGVGEKTCNMTSMRKTQIYTFNYTGFSSADLSYLVENIDADNATITQDQKNIFIKNPKGDAWSALTLLRNTEQK